MGEALHPKDVKPWWGKIRPINAYGPSECTPASIINFNTTSPEEMSYIGRGVGQLTWVVDPCDHHRLVPTGCVGELLLEGPLVGRGYLNDTERTAASFVTDPKWLLQGRKGEPGRRGRLYKTGDLVRYNKNGTLVFVGRKDTQVKLRGQRIELREVESYTKQCTPGAKQVVAEVIVPTGLNARPLLAVVIQKDGTISESDESPSRPLNLTVWSSTADVEDELSQCLPRYMVPSVFFVIDEFPLVPSGKIDRKILREMAEAFTVQQLAEVQTSRRETKRLPQTEMSRLMQQIWSQVLDIEVADIGLDDNFFRLGGDSIAAMNLVSEARRKGVKITVADMFKHRKLEHVAQTSVYLQNSDLTVVTPFSLLPSQVDLPLLLSDVASQCSVAQSAIQDIYPCTQLQEGLLSLSTRQGDYVTQFVLDISPDVDVSHFCKSWEICVQDMAILRTRIVTTAHDGLFQVVLDEPLSWIMASNLKEYMDADRALAMDVNQPLSRFALITDDSRSGSVRWFAWTLHHALYDGWSMSLMLNRFSQVFHGKTPSSSPRFNTFIKYIETQSREGAITFWRETLGGYVHTPFPAIPSTTDVSKTDSVAHRHVALQKSGASDITASTLIPAAWALLTGHMTNTSDVTFGTISSGRSAPVTGLADIIGPTMATFPMRVTWSEDLSIHQFLANVHQQRIDMIPYEQSGLQNISKLSHDAEQACNFQTLLIIQPPDVSSKKDTFGEWRDGDKEWYSRYPLVLFMQLGVGGVTAKASYDSKIIEPWMMSKLFEHFESLLHQLENSLNSNKTLSGMQKITTGDMDRIWGWNSVAPASVDCLAHHILEDQAHKYPSAQAVCSWDGELTYRALDDMATQLAYRLASIGVGPDVVVPLCFEKSMWAVVALFGVLKAGGTFILLDQSLPQKRIENIIQQVGADIMLASTCCHAGAERLSKSVVVLNQEYFDNHNIDSSHITLVEPTPDSIMYIVFTSGSTGTPKGLRISHRNFASSVHHQREYYGYTEESRVYDFFSYSFDMSIFAIFHSLASGSCVCVPNDEDRKTNLAGSIRSLKADSLVLTPSVSRSIKPSEVPDVKRMLLIGEALHVKDAETWWNKVNLLNTYGVSECTSVSTINYKASSPDTAIRIGHGVGLLTWVTHPDDPSSLVPVGCTGELLLEGPLVGPGYLNDAQTAAVFIDAPLWLRKGYKGAAGRHGRLYRTGDLVKYTEDGNIMFLGRKNTEAKIRGQRIDLGEVEYQVKQHLPIATHVIAEIIHPIGEDAQPVLAAFLQLEEGVSKPTDMQDFTADIFPVSPSTEDSLAEYLPRYMLPGIFFSVNQLPMTATGKTNRTRLRQFGSSLTVQELAQIRTVGQGPKRRPETEVELTLQRSWSDILHISPEIIGVDNSFFQLGGDSISAMQLVGAARKMRLNLSMADVFRYPRLEQLASLCVKAKPAASLSFEANTSVFLSPSERQNLLEELDTVHLGLRSEDVAEILPLNDFQRNLIQSANKIPQIFCNYFYLNLGQAPDLAGLMHRIYHTLETVPILKARFLPLAGSYWQVIPRHLDLPFEIRTVDGDLTKAADILCKKDLDHLNTQDYPFRATLLQSNSGRSLLILRISHTQYDGISMASIFNSVANDSQVVLSASPPGPCFTDYLSYISSRRLRSIEYWQEMLHGSSITSISQHLPLMSEQQTSRMPIKITQNTKFPPMKAGVTEAVLMSSAWAVLLASLSGKSDLTYSQLVAGRNAAMDGVENIIGPCINVIPVRVAFSSQTTVSALMQLVQDRFLSLCEADSLGMRDISVNCTDWPENAAIDSVIQHQNINETPDIQVARNLSQVHVFQNPHLIQSKVWITTRPQTRGVEVEFQANTHMMTSRTAEVLLESYCKIITQLASQPQRDLKSLINGLDISFGETEATQ